MQENRNNSQNGCDTRGTVCIDTRRVLDSCKDRDCFEDSRVYLTTFGDEVLASATNIRTRSAKIVCAYVGVDEVPFNPGFYQVTVRYYVTVELEACVGLGKSQSITGLSVLEKDVVLYGGEGTVTAYSSDPNNSYCAPCSYNNVSNNAPIAVVETVEPVILGSKVKECSCGCDCGCDGLEIPECVRCCLNGQITNADNAPRLYVSYGLFSVIRIERPAQLLVQATDYSVPDKECSPASNTENPCDLFRTISFPTQRFKPGCAPTQEPQKRQGGCGCGKND